MRFAGSRFQVSGVSKVILTPDTRNLKPLLPVWLMGISCPALNHFPPDNSGNHHPDSRGKNGE